ncbi:MAG: hypothetical protein D6784_00400 [Chloroflexi bacterium]|nr:MAG: hypothetical protein D6784_00400 [Chloroflexota bacterium]
MSREPLGIIEHRDMVNILAALAATDVDIRTLFVVAEAVGLSEYLADRLKRPVPLVLVHDRRKLPEVVQ